MNAPDISNFYLDFNGMASLKSRAAKNPDDALRQAAQQLEGSFIQMMLKAMREANLGDGIFDNRETQFYTEMFDSQIANEMARGQGIGLTEAIMRQLGGGGTSPPALPSRFPPMPSAAVTPKLDDEGPRQSQQSFVEEVLPHASAAAEHLDVNPHWLVAQAALETGWGKHVIRTADGRSSNNVFGVKAGPEWNGARVTVPTREYREGHMLTTTADFRVYPSLAEAFADYVAVVKDNPRYASQGDNDELSWPERLQQGGYATDPQYANKIKSIAQRIEILGTAADLKPQDL